jgi:hypothetical protein
MLQEQRRRFPRLNQKNLLDRLQKQKPGRLFGVVEFSGAPGLFPENVIDIFKRLLEH